MKKRITLLSVFICLFMLCTAMFAVTTAKANADGETYSVTYVTPMAGDYDMASSVTTWSSTYQMPVLNDDGGVTLTRDESVTAAQLNYATNVGKYKVSVGKTYVASLEMKTDKTIRFVLSTMSPDWDWKVKSDSYVEHTDYTEYTSEFTVTNEGAMEFIFQIMSAGNIYVKNFKLYEKNSVTVNGGAALGELPEVPAKAGYVGEWTIDGKAINKDTVYDYAADKTAVVTYKKLNTLTFLPENYDYDMAKDLSCWTDYQMPVLQDDGSALLIRPAGTEGAYNFLAGSNKLPVKAGAKYILTFDMKCDNIFINIANDNPWGIFSSGWTHNPNYLHYEYEYVPTADGFANIIFQTAAGEGNIYLKNFKFYEKIEKQYDADEVAAIGELPAITEKTGYVSYWAIDGEKITAETMYDYGTDKTAVLVRKRINTVWYVDNVYDNDLASSLTAWTRYNKPVLNDDGGVTLTRSDDETAEVLNYAAVTDYQVTQGKKYRISFSLKGVGRFAFAVETPKWHAFEDNNYNTNGAYKEIAYTYTAETSGAVSFIFQVQAGNTKGANINLKDFRFYEIVADSKTVTEGDAFGELVSLDENVGHFYRLGWKLNGVEVTANTVCDFARDVVIEKTVYDTEGHTATKVEAVAPDCENDGVKAYYDCSCGKHFADAEGKTEITDLDAWKAGDGKVDALGHTYDDGVVTTEPTCTEKGEKTYTCTVCEHTKTEDVNAKGHSAVEAWTNDETNHWHECTNGCGERLDETAHTYNDGVVTTEPTCTAKGVKTFTCTVCEHTKTEDVNAKGHSAVEAWTNDETNHWHECANGCGEHLDETAHTYDDGVVTTAPTCTEDGEKTYTCTECGQTKTETVEKTGHVDADDDGVCDACGETLKKKGGCKSSVGGSVALVALVAVAAVVMIFSKRTRKE